MSLLLYFFLFTCTYGLKCSLHTPPKDDYVYLCRQRLNITSMRVWLNYRFNQSAPKPNLFAFYTFTLRTVDLLDSHRIQLEDRFEKRIGDVMEINPSSRENHSISIYNLSPGRYEICVNLLSERSQRFFYRSAHSCLQIPWHVPEDGPHEPNLLIQISLMISIIILLVTSAFCIHTIHQYVKAIRPPIVLAEVDDADEQDEDKAIHERTKLIMHQQFEPGVNPFELMVRRRVHQRYHQWSPDLNEH